MEINEHRSGHHGQGGESGAARGEPSQDQTVSASSGYRLKTSNLIWFSSNNEDNSHEIRSCFINWNLFRKQSSKVIVCGGIYFQ